MNRIDHCKVVFLHWRETTNRHDQTGNGMTFDLRKPRAVDRERPDDSGDFALIPGFEETLHLFVHEEPRGRGEMFLKQDRAWVGEWSKPFVRSDSRADRVHSLAVNARDTAARLL